MNKAIVIISLLFLSTPLWAHGDAASDKPSIDSSVIVNLTSQVIALDYDSRELTMKNPDGEIVKFIVSTDEKNLDKVKVGDVIHMQVVDSLNIRVVAVRNAEPGSASSSVVVRNAEGEEPGMESVDTKVINAIVEEINLENNTIKLRGVNNVIEEYTAKNPDNLRKTAVGDLVVITYTTSVVVSLTHAVKE